MSPTPEQLERAAYNPDGPGPDPLIEQARALVVKNRKASISYVQRHLKIGYNRAARLLEALELLGSVSRMNSSGQRDVLPIEAFDQDALMAAYSQPGVRAAIDPAAGPDQSGGSVQTEGVRLFPWVRMTPDRPDDYPEQAWFLEGRNKVVPGVSLVVPHQLATRAHLGLRLSNGGSSFECALTFPPKELRALAQALLSAAALIDELLPAMEGGAS